MKSPDEIAREIIAKGWSAPAPAMARAIAQAILDERERSAAVARDSSEGYPGCGCPGAIAKAITEIPAPIRR